MKFIYFLVFICYLLNVTLCDKDPTKIKIDLDKPPEKRWVEACEKHSDMFKTLATFAERYTGGHNMKWSQYER